MVDRDNLLAEKKEKVERRGKVEREEIFGKVAEAIVSIKGIRKSDVKMESNLLGDLDVDSQDFIEIVLALEDEFGIDTTPDEERVEMIDTVEGIVNYLEEVLARG